MGINAASSMTFTPVVVYQSGVNQYAAQISEVETAYKEGRYGDAFNQAQSVQISLAGEGKSKSALLQSIMIQSLGKLAAKNTLGSKDRYSLTKEAKGLYDEINSDSTQHMKNGKVSHVVTKKFDRCLTFKEKRAVSDFFNNPIARPLLFNPNTAVNHEQTIDSGYEAFVRGSYDRAIQQFETALKHLNGKGMVFLARAYFKRALATKDTGYFAKASKLYRAMYESSSQGTWIEEIDIYRKEYESLAEDTGPLTWYLKPETEDIKPKYRIVTAFVIDLRQDNLQNTATPSEK